MGKPNNNTIISIFQNKDEKIIIDNGSNVYLFGKMYAIKDIRFNEEKISLTVNLNQ